MKPRTSRTKDAKDAKDPSKLAILWDINLQVDAHVARVQLPLPDTATVWVHAHMNAQGNGIHWAYSGLNDAKWLCYILLHDQEKSVSKPNRLDAKSWPIHGMCCNVL